MENYLIKRMISKENILYAINTLPSYLEYRVLPNDLRRKFSKYTNIYDSETLKNIIEEVQKNIKKLKDDSDYYLEVDVIKKLKSYDSNKVEYQYRYIHVPKNYIDLITMVSILNVFMYKKIDKNSEESDLSELIPSNFYGNLLGDGIDNIFVPWKTLYSKFRDDYVVELKKYTKTNEYKYEINLDFKSFFPSINPKVVISYILKFLSINKENSNGVYQLLLKILVLKLDLKEEDKENYYGDVNVGPYTIGLPQGLPQSMYFSNIIMTIISKEIEKTFSGRSLYYVDDVIIFTNDINFNTIKESIQNLNTNINKTLNKIIEPDYFNESLFGMMEEIDYKVQIHGFDNNEKSKTTLLEISKIKGFDLEIFSLAKVVSTLDFEMFISNDEYEKGSIYSKIKAFNELLNNKITKLKKKIINSEDFYNDRAHLIFLERILKFLMYREVILGTLIDKNIYTRFYNNLKNDLKKASNDNIEILLDEKLIELRLGIFNKLFGGSKKNESLESIIKVFDVDNKLLLLDILDQEELSYINEYQQLTNTFNFKGFNIYKINNNIKDLIDDLNNEESNLVSSLFKNKYLTILYYKSKDIRRKILNFVISLYFNIDPSNDIYFIKKANKRINYLELKLIVFLRNKYNDIFKFKEYYNEITKNNVLNINEYNVDYSLFEVLYDFVYNIREQKMIDNLIHTHFYVYSLWSNGSILFKYYTLHNEIHAIDIIKTIGTLSSVIHSQTLNKNEKYFLYLSAYLHDISMADLPSKDTYDETILEVSFYKDFISKIKGILSNKNAHDFENKLFREIENLSHDFMSKLTDYVRNNHAENSKIKINTLDELDYLNITDRNIVSIVSEAHNFNRSQLFFSKFDINDKFNMLQMILFLRLADVLDIGKNRAHEVVLKNSFEFIDDYSKYQWISHLVTNKRIITSDYKYDSRNTINEIVTIDISMNTRKLNKIPFNNTKYNIKYKVDEMNQNKYTITLNYENSSEVKKIPFALSWFLDKNKYLIKELSDFEKVVNNNYNSENMKTKIQIKLTLLKDNLPNKEYMEIVRKEVESNLKGN